MPIILKDEMSYNSNNLKHQIETIRMMSYNSGNGESETEGIKNNFMHGEENPGLQSNVAKAEHGARKLYELSDSDDSIIMENGSIASSQDMDTSQESKVGKNATKRVKLNKESKASKKIPQKKQATALEKQKRQLDREQKKQENLRNKEIKKALKASQRKIKPNECITDITVQIDSKFMDAHDQNAEISSSLRQLGSDYSSIAQLIPNTVTWVRRVETFYMDDETNSLKKSVNIKDENDILIFLSKDEICSLINDNKLIEHMTNVANTYPGKKISLGMLRFLSQNPLKLSKEQILCGLTELQIFCNCSYRDLYSIADLASMITQFTKSIAQKPFKLQRHEKQIEEKWYIQGDNKNCVKVDQQGNGISRLWQQQLIAFPQARLETAESIIEKYPSLPSLMQAYNECPLEKRELMLADIPIRRNIGPICSSSRHVGRELSKKINIVYNSLDGEAIVGNSN